MKCVNHPEKDAVSMCVSCGTGLCADCRQVVRGASYCADCAATHEPVRIFPGRATAGYNVWAILGWVLAVVGWWPGWEIVSIAGIVLGFVALADLGAHNVPQRGRGYAYAAIACGMLGLLVKLAVVIYIFSTGLAKSPFDAYKYLGM